MASPSKKQLMAENSRLKKELSEVKKSNSQKNGGRLKGILKWLAFSLALAILVVANLTFYIGRTLTETDKFMAVASPLIRQPAVQEAIADKANKEFFSQINTEELISSVLPEQAALLAPTLSKQIEKFTLDKSKEILASEGFQSIYDKALEKTHSGFITAIKSGDGDGIVSVSDLYDGLSQRLVDSKLSFLANKQLPANIGNIEVVKADWVPTVRNLVIHLDTIRVVTFGLFGLLVLLFVWLSHNRRRAVVQLSVGVALVGLVSILAVNLTGSLVVSEAKNYPEAARQIWEVLSAPLITQTAGAVGLASAIGLVAWIGGSGKTAAGIRRRLDALLSGKLHQSLFPKENGLSRWFGRYRRHLLALSAVGFILSVAIIDISLASFLAVGLVFLAICLIIELISAKQK